MGYFKVCYCVFKYLEIFEMSFFCYSLIVVREHSCDAGTVYGELLKEQNGVHLGSVMLV